MRKKNEEITTIEYKIWICEISNKLKLPISRLIKKVIIKLAKIAMPPTLTIGLECWLLMSGVSKIPEFWKYFFIKGTVVRVINIDVKKLILFIFFN